MGHSKLIACIKIEEDDSFEIPRPIHFPKRPLADDLTCHKSPDWSNNSRHVVIVMDALKEFNQEPLQWALDHVIGRGYIVTLLGVMPWVPLALSLKIGLDVWRVNLEDLAALKAKCESTSDVKYRKVQGIIELCDKNGVVPSMKVAMGHPKRYTILEEIASLHATWVVFDRHYRKKKTFYATRLPCNVVMMNSDGGVDMLKVQPMIDNSGSTPETSLASLPPTPEVIFSKHLQEMLDQGSMKSITKVIKT